MPTWLSKVSVGKNILVSSVFELKAASWVTRIATVAWEVGALENARTYFEIDDSSTFATQQVPNGRGEWFNSFL